MRFPELLRPLLYHLFQLMGNFFLLLQSLSDISADVDEFRNLAVFLPNRVHIDFEMSSFPFGIDMGMNLLGVALVADHIL